MSNEKTIEEEMEEILNTISELEERMRTTDLKLSDAEADNLKSLKLKLSEYEKSFQKELDRIISDAVKAGDGADFGITEKQ